MLIGNKIIITNIIKKHNHRNNAEECVTRVYSHW